MKNRSKLLSLLLVLSMLLSLAACTKDTEPKQPDIPPTPGESVDTVDTELPINIMVLNGTTGFGMAKLIADAENGESMLRGS